jgi:hypothetical protein
MDIPNYLDYLEKKADKKAINNRRAYLISLMVDEINKDRIGTKFPAIKPKAVAIKTSHLGISELDWFHHNCLEYKQRNGSYSKFFFGSLKSIDRKF